jgi:hypothetical protein
MNIQRAGQVIGLLAVLAMAAVTVAIPVLFVDLAEHPPGSVAPPAPASRPGPGILPPLVLIFATGCVLVAFLIAGVVRLHRRTVTRRAGAAGALRDAGEGGEAA